MRAVRTETQPEPPLSWLLLGGIALISFSLIAYEISLTRVLSVLLTSSYVFVIVSVAMLGLGMGAAAVHVVRSRNPSMKPLSLAPAVAAIMAISLPASVFVMAALGNSTTGASALTLYIFLMTVPFTLAGTLYAEIFRGLPSRSSRIYGLDLIGASAGALGVVLLLNRFGATTSTSLLGVIAAAGSGLVTIGIVGRGIKKLALPGVSLLVLLTLLTVQLTGILKLDVPVGTDPNKEIFQLLRDPKQPGKIVETRESSFGRTDLVSFPPQPDIMSLFIDGVAGSTMYRFSGDITQPGDAVASLTEGFSGYLPLSVVPETQKNNALIIGPGGGRDVLVSLLAGVKKITAVEVNPQVVDFVKEYRSYNGGLYTDFPNVSVVVDEGRNFLRSQTEKYDLIMLSIPVTKTSRSIDGFAQTENYLFTTESMRDYFDHLTDQGQLVVVAHTPVEIARLTSLAFSALSRKNMDNAAVMQRMYVIGSHHNPAFVLKKTPLTTAEAEVVHRAIHDQGYDPSSSYVPAIKSVSSTNHEGGARFLECASLDTGYVALSTGLASFSSLESYSRKYDVDLSAVNDNRPFYYKFGLETPASVSAVVWSSLAALAALAAAALWTIKRRSSSKKRGSQAQGAKQTKLPLTLFALIGIGFMLVEVSTIQRLTLFLGQPVLSTAVILFSMLVGAGLGSMSSGRVPADRTGTFIAIACLVTAVIIAIYVPLVPAIVTSLPSLALAGRVSLTVLFVTPLGFIMGMPFPLGIRLMKESDLDQYVPLAWAINGVSSVLGSGLAVFIALSSGFSQAMLAAALAYSAAAALFFLAYAKSQPPFPVARPVRQLHSKTARLGQSG